MVIILSLSSPLHSAEAQKFLKTTLHLSLHKDSKFRPNATILLQSFEEFGDLLKFPVALLIRSSDTGNDLSWPMIVTDKSLPDGAFIKGRRMNNLQKVIYTWTKNIAATSKPITTISLSAVEIDSSMQNVFSNNILIRHRASITEFIPHIQWPYSISETKF